MNNSLGNKSNNYNPFYNTPPKAEEKIDSVAMKIVSNFLPETPPSPPKFIE